MGRITRPLRPLPIQLGMRRRRRRLHLGARAAGIVFLHPAKGANLDKPESVLGVLTTVDDPARLLPFLETKPPETVMSSRVCALGARVGVEPTSLWVCERGEVN